ncbi:DNA-directed RNA polymerase sigma-70 factor [Chishuiella changwenlii]|uniref:DNA-directed RNA polymerase sigma-70 factor n=3 Tax=Chishuiella changwenlii TaxID=1434701 RepID=A0ABQ1THR8_9FLAO|nr:DNA-directed RNA polymerase sigma-70 factor [Chishuiella changwenlii]
MKTQQEFLNLIDQHKGILHKVSKMYMDDIEDQNDLVQEIVLQLWKSYERFQSKSQFSTWMYRVSLNTALTYFKKEKKKSDRYTFLENLDKVDETDTLEKETQLELFYKAVHELNKVEKALIFLFLEGQSHKEIASNLGITEVNARVKLNRTKEKIQIIIKTYGYEF